MAGGEGQKEGGSEGGGSAVSLVPCLPSPTWARVLLQRGPCGPRAAAASPPFLAVLSPPFLPPPGAVDRSPAHRVSGALPPLLLGDASGFRETEGEVCWVPLGRLLLSFLEVSGSGSTCWRCSGSCPVSVRRGSAQGHVLG